MNTSKNKQSAFTIVELLIVIVVIGVLASLVLSSFASAQDKAREASQQNDIKLISKAMTAARVNKGQPAVLATNSSGSDCIDCTCRNLQTAGNNLNAIPKTYACWVEYVAFIDRLSAASGANLQELKKGNPWGAPYLIDLNEGVNGECREDTIVSSGKDGAYDLAYMTPMAKTDSFDTKQLVPFSLPNCM